jgi:hypothetical protein
MKKNIDLKLQQKIYIQNISYYIPLCRFTHLESNTIEFSIL